MTEQKVEDEKEKEIDNLLEFALKSIPAVGSSNKTNLDPPINAIATDSFLLDPPDKFLAIVLLYYVRSTSLSILSISCFYVLESTPIY